MSSHTMEPQPNYDALPTTIEPTCPDYFRDVVLQEGNSSLRRKIQPRESAELSDNRIGFTYDVIRGSLSAKLRRMCRIGIKWVRMGFWSPCPLTWQEVLRAPGVHVVEPDFDEHVTQIAENGIRIVCSLGVGAGISGRWATPHHGALGEREPKRWFKTDEQIAQYVDYARFMARHFTGRISWFEVWNEPDAGPGDAAERGGIDAEDYAIVAQRVSEAIREENPDAKLVVGAVGRFAEGPRRYVEEVLRNGAAACADAISWHPFYGDTPVGGGHGVAGGDYWSNYPTTVADFCDRARELDFRGGFMTAEMVWRTPDTDPHPTERCDHTELTAAKYQARGTLINLGLGAMMADNQMQAAQMLPVPRTYAIRTLCNVMAGAAATEIPVTAVTSSERVVSHGFSLSDGRRLVAVWNDVEARDYDAGTPGTLRITSDRGRSVVGIDALNGFEQSLTATRKANDVEIGDVLIRDYPLLLRLDE